MIHRLITNKLKFKVITKYIEKINNKVLLVSAVQDHHQILVQ